MAAFELEQGTSMNPCVPTTTTPTHPPDCTTSTAVVSSKPKQIRWKSIEIHEHPIIVGDNPSVLRGVPLTIDWTSTATYCFDLDTYETQKQRRQLNEIIMSAADREKLLLNRLEPPRYTKTMLVQAQRMAAVTRNQRRQTNQARRWDSCHEQLEKMTRTIQRMMGTRPSKRSERDYLQLHCARTAATAAAATTATTPDGIGGSVGRGGMRRGETVTTPSITLNHPNVDDTRVAASHQHPEDFEDRTGRSSMKQLSSSTTTTSSSSGTSVQLSTSMETSSSHV